MKFAWVIAALGLLGFAAGYFRGGETAQATGDSRPARSDAGLRSKDPAELLASLRKLAEDDPRAFFKELRHFPELEGLQEIVTAAAARLAEDNPADAADLLNRIPNFGRLRERAWHAFVTSLRDRSPLEKIRIARLAGYLADSVIHGAVIMPALAANPAETLQALRDSDETAAYCLLLGELGKLRSTEVMSILKDDLASRRLKPAECQVTLENLARNHPTAEVLSSIGGLIRDHGWGEGLYAGPIFTGAFNHGEKTLVLDTIARLPAVQKNFVLSRLPLGDCPPDLAAQVVNAMDSTELQLGALREIKGEGADPARIAAVHARIASERTRQLWQAETNSSDP